MLLEPERIVPRPVVRERPVVTRSSQQTTPTRNVSASNPNSVAAAPANATNPSANNARSSSRSRIESRWTYNQRVQNGFYAGYCTWYAAIISPGIFGPVVDGQQDRPFGGNANRWAYNAEKA